MTRGNDDARCARSTRVPVRDGETLSFRPGGRHLMLFDLDRRVAAGGRIDLVLHFERGAPVTLAATLVPTGGDVGPLENRLPFRPARDSFAPQAGRTSWTSGSTLSGHRRWAG